MSVRFCVEHLRHMHQQCTLSHPQQHMDSSKLWGAEVCSANACVVSVQGREGCCRWLKFTLLVHVQCKVCVYKIMPWYFALACAEAVIRLRRR